MGSYLSEPVTEKVSSDEANDKLKCGASSMQGWRVTQEDAHNCLLDFDVNTSLFAVYDGHGGHEVAVYCSQKLPQFLKETEAYKSGDFHNALVTAFLDFDATIATREVVAELKQIAGVKEGENESSSSDLEENVNNLYEEATMPLEQVIEKYTSNLKNPILQNLQKDGEKHPVSPYLRARKDASTSEACSSLGESSNSKNSGSVVSSSSNDESGEQSSNSLVNASTTADSSKAVEENGSLKIPEINVEVVDSSGDVKDNKAAADNLDLKNSEVDIKAEGDVPNQNGELQTPTKEKSQDISDTPQENGEISKKGKGKAIAKTKGVPKLSTMKMRPKRNAQQLYSKLLELESESESEDEEDKTFQGPTEESSSDEEETNVPTVDNDNDSEASTEEEEEDELEEDLDDMEEEEDEEMDEANIDFARNMSEEPGSDSGCTAVVALLHENQLFVANAGDSRCIVCRNGKAVEMSFDHKPEDEREHQRVVMAGGKVTLDGRVNGGLNLSRAIGDHAYKQKKELSACEQMITALPDVRTLTINPGEDEFMVLACDGIWNFMSSQQVVDFVKPRLEKSPEKISQICEELFEHCLAPNTVGDGTGCDNMTAIIVQFKNSLCKRAAPSDEVEESGNIKRVKTDENHSQVESTA